MPWRRKWRPTAVLSPGEFHGQRNLVGYSPWGREAGRDWEFPRKQKTFQRTASFSLSRKLSCLWQALRTLLRADSALSDLWAWSRAGPRVSGIQPRYMCGEELVSELLREAGETCPRRVGHVAPAFRLDRLLLPGQQAEGATEDEMVGWHPSADSEFVQAPGDGEGRGSSGCCSPWGRRESDTTQWRASSRGAGNRLGQVPGSSPSRASQQLWFSTLHDQQREWKFTSQPEWNRDCFQNSLFIRVKSAGCLGGKPRPVWCIRLLSVDVLVWVARGVLQIKRSWEERNPPAYNMLL